MNTRTIALSLLVATASFASAQEAAPQATTVTRSESYRDKIIRELKLTPEQITKFDQIETAHRESARELNSSGLDPQASQERARSLRDDKDKQMKAMLTAEQYDKLVAIRKSKHDATRDRQQAPGHQE